MTVLRGIKPPDAKLSPLKLSLNKMAFRLNISFRLKKEALTLGRGFSLQDLRPRMFFHPISPLGIIRRNLRKPSLEIFTLNAHQSFFVGIP